MSFSFTFESSSELLSDDARELMNEFASDIAFVTQNGDPTFTVTVEADTLLEAIRNTLDSMQNVYANALGAHLPVDVEDAIWAMQEAA